MTTKKYINIVVARLQKTVKTGEILHNSRGFFLKFHDYYEPAGFRFVWHYGKTIWLGETEEEAKEELKKM